MLDALAALARLEGVPSAVAAATAAVDVVLRDRGLREVSAEAAAQARWIGARGNAELTEDPERWFPGALRAAAETTSLAEVVRVAPMQAIARVHALAARGIVGDDELGRVRSAAGLTERLRGVAELLTTPSEASGMVLAAVVHAELATLEPFAAGSGVVARAVEHLVLVSVGLDPRAAIVVEAGHAAASDRYLRLLHGYTDGGLAGVRAWLLHCAEAVTVGAERSPLTGV